MQYNDILEDVIVGLKISEHKLTFCFQIHSMLSCNTSFVLSHALEAPKLVRPTILVFWAFNLKLFLFVDMVSLRELWDYEKSCYHQACNKLHYLAWLSVLWPLWLCCETPPPCCGPYLSPSIVQMHALAQAKTGRMSSWPLMQHCCCSAASFPTLLHFVC